MAFENRKIANRELPAIGLGCMSLSQAYFPLPDRDTALNLVHKAIDLGCVHLDTARLYGLGHNEELLSEILATRRSEVFLATKCGIENGDGKRWIDCSPKNVRASLELSLRALGTDHVDLFYLHRRDFDVPIEESVGELARLKKEGKIGALGLSEMSADTLRKAYQEHPIDALQSEYSLWTRNAELGTLSACEELDVAYVAFSPVARGTLAGGVKDPMHLDAKDLRTKHPRFNVDNWPSNQQLVGKFEELASDVGVTPAQLSLVWVLSQSDVIHAIPGTANFDHLHENWMSLTMSVRTEVLTEAGRLINQSTVSGHRYPEGMRRTIDTEDYPD